MYPGRKTFRFNFQRVLEPGSLYPTNWLATWKYKQGKLPVATLRRFMCFLSSQNRVKIDPSEIICVIRCDTAGQSLLDDFLILTRLFGVLLACRYRECKRTACGPGNIQRSCGNFFYQCGYSSRLGEHVPSLCTHNNRYGEEISICWKLPDDISPDFGDLWYMVTDNSRSTGERFRAQNFEYPVIPRVVANFTTLNWVFVLRYTK